MPSGCVIWLNGAFGVGKTTVARALASRLPDALILDPEDIGRMLCRTIPAARRTTDFQDIPSWRRVTVATIESLLRDHPAPLVVPMTVVDPHYFDETVGRLRRAGITVHHFTLAASPKTIRRRLLRRVSVPWATWWALRRVERCTSALRSSSFATEVNTEHRSVPDIAAAILGDVLASDACAFYGFRPFTEAGQTRDQRADRPTARRRTPLVWLHPSPHGTELDNLLARVTADNSHGEVETGPSVGSEAW